MLWPIATTFPVTSLIIDVLPPRRSIQRRTRRACPRVCCRCSSSFARARGAPLVMFTMQPCRPTCVDTANGGETMADDLTKTGAADRNRININEDYEVVYWTMRFGVSREQ